MPNARKLLYKIVPPAVLALSALGVAAQTIEDVSPVTGVNTVATLKSAVTTWLNVAIGAIGIVAVVLLLWGGYLYLTAGTSEDNSKKAKSIILYAFLGMIVAALAFALVNVFGDFIGRVS